MLGSCRAALDVRLVGCLASLGYPLAGDRLTSAKRYARELLVAPGCQLGCRPSIERGNR